jgi:hypothetical protein
MDFDVTKVVNAVRKIFGKEPLDRHFYASPGKQFKEVLRYIQVPEGPIEQIGAKMAPVTQGIVEQFTKHQMGSGWPLAFAQEDLTPWQSLTARGAAILDKFKPFVMQGNNFALTLPMRRGMGWWQGQKAYEDLLKNELDPGLFRSIYNSTVKLKNVQQLKNEIDKAAKDNGLDPDKIYKQANSNLRGEYYNKLWKAIKAGDKKSQEKYAKILLKLGVNLQYLEQSGKRRDLHQRDILEGKQKFIKEFREGERPLRLK